MAVFKYAICTVFVILASEVFLNLVLSPTIEKSLWFTTGIHTPDETFGFVFTPNYRGWMRHADGVFLAPLKLEEHGFRLPVKPTSSKQNVVLIGGYSMAFSYGLTDDLTLHRFIGASLSTPTSVYNTAWPGFDSFRNFHVYKHGLAKDLRPDFAVILFYQETLASFADLPEDLDRFPDDRSTDERTFEYFDGTVVNTPPGRVSRALGGLYYESIIAHNLSQRLTSLEKVLLKSPADDEVAGVKIAEKPSADTEGAKRFKAWTTYLQKYFGGKGNVLFVFTPYMAEQLTDARRRFYEPLIANLPTGADYLDLNKSLAEAVDQNGYIGWGHYSGASAALLGKAIARRVDGIQHSAVARTSRDLRTVEAPVVN